MRGGDGSIGITTKGGMGDLNKEDEYIEKPRPSLYAIVKKLKETGHPMTNRICILSKIQDSHFKGGDTEKEKEITNWVTTLCQSHHGPEGFDIDQLYGGFAVILGPWIVHLFEAETSLMEKFVKKLHEKLKEPGSYYVNIWVIHYTEDIPTRSYNFSSQPNWSAKCIDTKNATREIKTMGSFEKSHAIYASMVKIGVDCMAV